MYRSLFLESEIYWLLYQRKNIPEQEEEIKDLIKDYPKLMDIFVLSVMNLDCLILFVQIVVNIEEGVISLLQNRYQKKLLKVNLNS